MDAERWRNLERIYHTALEREPEERGKFIAEACEGDEEFRRELESLLAQDVAANGPLDRPAWEDAASLPEDALITRLEPGMQLGPYRIGSPIGAGGMGRVYKAHDSRLGRDVALKVLREDITEYPRRRSRLESEARAVAVLNHPHICTLHDIGPNYLVMEYIAGETLAARIAKGPIPVDQVLRIGIEIASALEAAHRHGIIHRDLKPGNIMLTDSGTKLLDFGLAKFEDMRVATQPSTAMTETDSEHLFGTLPYMSPEQLEGEDADARSDIFSFGAILYGMVTGQRAFQRNSTAATVTAICREPKLPSEFASNVPHHLERIIYRCLRKSRGERYSSASSVVRELEDCRSIASEPVSGINFKALLRQSRRPRVAIPVLLTVVFLGTLSGWWIWRDIKARRARTEVLPKISQLIEQEKLGEAYALAVKAERYISDDPALGKLWPKMSYLASVRTIPPGATVYRRKFGIQNNEWEPLGRSPIEKYRLPLVDSQWRFELAGFVPAERLTLYLFKHVFPDESISVKMDQDTSAPPGMVRQTNGLSNSAWFEPLEKSPAVLVGLPGFEDAPEILLKDYWIDRFEVTNRQFKEFVDKGGYRKPELWKHSFNKGGRNLSWRKAIDLFRDTTGRPGPATWALSDYPRGRDDFPVSGVSWYEAAAYAEFVGKALPTIYHWTTAASPWASSSLLPLSNFGRQGPAPVGSSRSMSWFGSYDMAGNVKEWCWNEADAGKRYILGGAWDEPLYMFNNADARSPFERSPNFGFRCARYVSTGAAAKAADPLPLRARDFDRENPVSDELFAVYKSLYSYDKVPLHAIVESAEQSQEWIKEKITFTAAYGNERVIAYLFLPRKSQPRFQTIVYFPGSEVMDFKSSVDLPEMEVIEFLVKSGRAVIFPLYKGTFERGDGIKSDLPNTSVSWRDHMIAWSKDLERSIDYLETRPQIDSSRLAYVGYSWGAAMGSVMPAVEPRIKVCVLISGGFYLQKSLPEVDELNFAPRVKVPVLMLNGRFDFMLPPETSQEPMFRVLGTLKENKRRVVYDTGHNIPRNELIRETLNWLDHYLGAVN